MPVTSTPILPQTIRNGGTTFVNADGTTIKDVLTAGADGSIITALNVASTDTTARDIRFFLNNGSTDLLLCVVNVPISSGNTNAAAPVDVFRNANCPGLAFDANGNRVLFLQAGYRLRAQMLVAVTAAQTISVVATSHGDY